MGENNIINTTIETEVDDNVNDVDVIDLENDEDIKDSEYGRGQDNDYPDPLGEDE